MTLADERRAIAQGMAASRAATGADERRAIGQRMVNERRGIKEDLNALEKSPRKSTQLPKLEKRGTRVASMGVGHWNPARAAVGGIAGPLTEVETAPGSGLALREYHEGETLFYATDYIMAVEIRPLKSTTMVDGTGASVPLVFQRPVTGGGGDVR